MDKTVLYELAADIRATIERFLAQDESTQVHGITVTYLSQTGEKQSICGLQINQSVTILNHGKELAAKGAEAKHVGDQTVRVPVNYRHAGRMPPRAIPDEDFPPPETGPEPTPEPEPYEEAVRTYDKKRLREAAEPHKGAMER